MLGMPSVTPFDQTRRGLMARLVGCSDLAAAHESDFVGCQAVEVQREHSGVCFWLRSSIQALPILSAVGELLLAGWFKP